ncbi:MAG: TonB-dependent receptor [Prevotellaceae bacterium]|jgi:hypothetical protein|nr:TonB-dependent receptor [Prevotellaceae bacterium]
MKRVIYLTALTALLLPAKTLAQRQAADTTLTRTVVVEQSYNPDILDASKVNVLPAVEPPAVSGRAVEYDTQAVPASEIPLGTMPSFSAPDKQPRGTRGYARFGMGNYGNLEGRAGYDWAISERDRLEVNFRTVGMNGDLTAKGFNASVERMDQLVYPIEMAPPPLPRMPGNKWGAYHYNTDADLRYTHSFRNADVYVGGNLGVRNFNLLSYPVNRKLKYTRVAGYAGIRSNNDNLSLHYSLEGGYRYFGRKDFPAEDELYLKAEATRKIVEEHRIGLGVSFAHYWYARERRRVDYPRQGFLTLNPHYLLAGEALHIRLGVNLDFGTYPGQKTHVSPDVKVQYTFADHYVAYAQATGRRNNYDYRRVEQYSPYITSGSYWWHAGYEQINASVGFKASPTNGLWFHLYGGYQQLKNDACAYLITRRDDNANSEDFMLYDVGLGTIDTHNSYAGAELRYSYKDKLTFSANGIYRNWAAKEHGDKASLYFKPKLELNFALEVRPIAPLSVTIGYQQITRKGIEGVADTDQAQTLAEVVSPVNNLHAGCNYELLKNVSIYARIRNILNRSYQYYEYYPAEKLNFIGGLSFRF